MMSEDPGELTIRFAKFAEQYQISGDILNAKCEY